MHSISQYIFHDQHSFYRFIVAVFIVIAIVGFICSRKPYPIYYGPKHGYY